VASVWLVVRKTKDGSKRYRCEFRCGGREAPTQYGGSFKTRREAGERKRWVAGELAARRVPDLGSLEAATRAPTLAVAAEAWRASRLDVVEQTGNMHRSAVARIFKVAPALRAKRIDQLSVDDVTELVAALHAKPYKRETIKKTRDALAMTLDFFAIDPNVARDDRVKLPKERKAHVPPPLAEHVERVADVLPRQYVVPFLVIDECGPRVSELETAQVGDLDEHRRAIRVRWTVEKNDRYRHLELPDDLFTTIVATLPPREDRDLEVQLFAGLDEAALRTAIARACKAIGTPHFSPHGLRRRRGSLHYKRTGSLAEVAELLGDSKRVAADHYVYALTDYREVDRSIALERARAVPAPVPPQRLEVTD
jgi:integrase